MAGQFNRRERYCVCDACGYHVLASSKCAEQHECIQPAPGLGDYTEGILQSIGVTKERYQAAKQLFGLSPTCDCDQRKEWLNRVSAWWRGVGQ